jgi:carboxymethylenebutenolidase
MSESSSADHAGKIATRWLELSSPKATPRLARANFSVYEARPLADQEIRGAIVVIQEIFGLNSHIRSLTERYAAEGFIAWAPAYFDHIQTGVELDYNADGIAKGRDLITQLGWDQAVEDTRLACEGVRAELAKVQGLAASARKVATIGFCWGGSVAWLMSTRAPQAIDTAVGYYGRAIWDFRNEKPLKPVLLHYGKHDHGIPLAQVDDVHAAHPQVPLYVYDAGHGFNCDARADYNATAANLAHTRTSEFLEKNFT